MTAPAPPRARPGVVAAAALFVVLVCGSGVFAAAVRGHEPHRRAHEHVHPAPTSRVQIDADGDVVRRPEHRRAGPRAHPRPVRAGRARAGRGVHARRHPARRELHRVPRRPLRRRYAIEVPPSFAVAIDGADGDVTASRLSGPLTIDRVTGDITVLDLAGPTRPAQRHGRDQRRAACARGAPGRLRHGDLRLELLVAPQSVDATTETGEITWPCRPTPPTAWMPAPTPATNACSCRSTRLQPAPCTPAATPAM